MRQHNYFSGKVIWITGASSGIGEALAYRLAGTGAKLILSARHEDALNRINCICMKRAQSLVLPLDLTNENSLHGKVQLALSAWGGIDILVNNAGVSQRSLGKDTNIGVDRMIMETNYFGPVQLTKGLLEHFRQKGGGQFIIMSSVSGKIGLPYRTAYSASKHALEGFYGALRTELTDTGTHILMVRAGAVQTPIAEHALTGDGSLYGQQDKLISRGMVPGKAARLILEAAERKADDLDMGTAKEKMLFMLNRLAPKWAFKAVKNLKP